VKNATKVLLLVLSLLIGVPLVAWTGTFLYWHFTILRAIRTLDDPARLSGRLSTPELLEAGQTLETAGCRSYPYLVRALGSARNPRWILIDLSTVFCQGTLPRGRAMDPPTQLAVDLVQNMAFGLEPSPGELRERVRRIQEWWHDSGHEFHQGWRVWSSNCSSKN
jgi:hypothetical protein